MIPPVLDNTALKKQNTPMAEKPKKDILERLVPILLVLTIVLAIAVGALWREVSNMKGGTTNTAGQAANNQPADLQPDVNGKLSEEQAKNLEPVNENDHIRGSRDAKVFLIEYSDFECPFCAQFHPTAQQALEEYGDDIAWVYRHFPLDTLHPRARPAALASECVANLAGNDAFWAFSDELFENQETSLTDAGLKNAAVKAGVNASEFDSCYSDAKFESEVENDYQLGITAGVTGTPGNFIMNSNGDVWVIPGAVPYGTLKATIDEALK